MEYGIHIAALKLTMSLMLMIFQLKIVCFTLLILD